MWRTDVRARLGEIPAASAGMTEVGRGWDEGAGAFLDSRAHLKAQPVSAEADVGAVSGHDVLG